MAKRPTYEDLELRCEELEKRLTSCLQTEEALQFSEERFAAFMEHLPAAVFIKNAESRYLYVNRFYEDTFGTRKGFIGKTPGDVFSEETARSMILHDREVLSKGSSRREERLLEKSGAERIYQTQKILMKGRDGSKLIGGFALDITQQRRANEALRESEERYRSIVENAHDGIVIIDDSFHLEYANDEICRMMGYGAEELVGADFRKFLDEESLHYTVDRYRRRLAGESVPPRYEINFVRKDGTKIRVEASLSIVSTETGEKKTIAQLLDITERKKGEEALRKSQATLERVFQALPMGLGLVQDRVMQWHNNAMSKILGYGSEELQGKSPRMLYSNEEDFRRVWATVSEAILDREMAEVETRWVRKDGSIVDCLARYTLIDPEMEASPVLSMVEDISFRKRAEEENKKLEAQLFHAQKMEAVGTLAGGVAHDFNNLLQAILGYTQMLLMDLDGSEAETSKLKQIEKSAQRASELTQQLLTFSRKVESKLRPIDLNDEVKQVRQLLERTIPRMIDIEVHLQDDPWIINGDPSQIEQIMMNLGVNARDAMSEGGKLLFETENVVLDREYCSAHLGARPGRYVLLSISDSGMGMDKTTVEHVFEPFFTTKEVGKGTGLGLAMVYGIVKNHDGYIMCYSEPEKGTIFKIYFPALETEGVKEEKAPGEEALEGGNETILLVDDEESLRQLGKELLRRFGYTVITATDGETAIETWKEKREVIALVILDLVMPGMGGKQSLEALLEMDPGLKVVIASGYSVNGRTKEALDAGARGFIRKPYEIREVLKVIRKVLDH
ncbi:MAG: PAS domain S-box protein [Desulfatiglandaceae bacterium]